MGRLFDKFLIATINQRIPMPKVWQQSLGLKLTDTKQMILSDGMELESTGYKFQQDDTIDRGFVTGRILYNQLTDKDYYQIALYLEALKEHQGKNFTAYFNSSTSLFENNKYITTISVIAGEPYTVYCRTELPVKWKYYSSASQAIFGEGELGALYESLLIDTNEYNTDDYQSEHEYFTLEVESHSAATIVKGRFNIITEDNEFTKGKTFKPSILNGDRYSDKLIPGLLDIQVTKESSTELRELLAKELSGEGDLEQKIAQNTQGAYDIDEFIGRNLRW